MADTYIKISELEETTLADDSSYIPIDNGNHTYKISVENYNSGANATAQSYAEAAAASADDAETAKTAAETAETETGLIRTATQQYATAASGSASAAASSAVDALNYADSAASAAANAADSAQDAAESYTNATEKAVLSESWAVGGTNTRTGEDTNNSQYYAAVAKSAAENAEDQVELANAASQAASGSAVDAAASATEASGYAGDASDSASDASTSASAAATQATNAANSAGAAATSATNAAASATAASGSASTATTQATNAAQSATTAGGYATQAASSASDASGYATNAANSATAAAGSATTASNQATAAAGSATAAASSASDAADSAADAAESAATFTTDDTLSIAGKAADAKAAGDMIAAVQAEIPELDNWLTTPGAAAEAKHTGDRITEVEDDVADLKSAIDNIEDVLDIVDNVRTGSGTHTTTATSEVITLIDDITLESGVSYTAEISLDSAVSKTVYGYVTDSGGTNLATFAIASGNTTASRTFTANANYVGCALKFTVGLADVIAYGVFTKNVTSQNAIERIEADVASVTAIAESTASDLSKILLVEQKGNAFQIATDILDGRYYYRNSGALANAANANFYSYIVKVIPHSTYTFNNSDIVLLDGDKVPLTSTESWDYRSVTTCNSGEAEYMAVNAYKASIPAGGCIFSQGTELDDSTYSEIYYAKSKPNAKPIKSSVSGDISAGGTLLLSGRSAIKDGQTIVFKSKISSFGTIRLDFTGGYSENYIEFDATNLTVKNSSTAAQVLPHGLTIVNEVTLIVRIVESHVLISLTSGGVSYETDLAWNQTGAAVTEYQISTTGTVCTGAVLASTYSAARRRIWYFGDSYIAFGTDTRVPYYAYEYGCGENICFCGASGGTSVSAVTAFRTLLVHGTPEFAVIATGMNDGGDSTNPSSGWLSAVQNFIDLCETEGITPVLCTVPTVPTVNNEQKNQWVRNSGYRYIDYASAVGADSSGVWYSGMIASDNIHPSTLGGNALFTQLATDLPEIFSN